jgi:hypothetical protein
MLGHTFTHGEGSMATHSEDKPSPYQLWLEAEGDGERYRQLLHDHGYLISPGEPGYDEASKNLSCGWPHRKEDK